MEFRVQQFSSTEIFRAGPHTAAQQKTDLLFLQIACATSLPKYLTQIRSGPPHYLLFWVPPRPGPPAAAGAAAG